MRKNRSFLWQWARGSLIITHSRLRTFEDWVMHRRGCDLTDHPHIGRRELLQVGGMSILGAGLGDLLRLEAQASSMSAPKKAKSVVFIFQSGGPSQHETF